MIYMKFSYHKICRQNYTQFSSHFILFVLFALRFHPIECSDWDLGRQAKKRKPDKVSSFVSWILFLIWNEFSSFAAAAAFVVVVHVVLSYLMVLYISALHDALAQHSFFFVSSLGRLKMFVISVHVYGLNAFM